MRLNSRLDFPISKRTTDIFFNAAGQMDTVANVAGIRPTEKVQEVFSTAPGVSINIR